MFASQLKKTSTLILALSLAAAPAFAANKKADKKKEEAKKVSAAQVVKIDSAASQVSWEGKKVTGKHNGAIKLKDGEVELKNGKLAGGTINIDMTSITNEDVKDAEYNQKLIGHLKSDDFFGVDKNPVSTLKITQVKPGTGDQVQVTGDLTIKGKTQPVTFPATVSVKDGKASAEGKITIDRTKFDIRYGSGKFFQNLGDKMINDTFDIQFKAVGNI